MRTEDRPKRYALHEVEAALYATRRGMFTPHDQIVLAAEVQAFRAGDHVGRALRTAHALLLRVRALVAKTKKGATP